MYADDPSFANTRVVYSLFDDRFEGTLDSRMVEKLKMDGFSDEDLAVLAGGDVDSIRLNKLAIDYADAVIQSSENVEEELIEYAKASGKPFLAYPGENNTEAYAEFYSSL